MIPYVYLSYENRGLTMQRVTDQNTHKTKVLKVGRQRTNTIFEMIEFEGLPEPTGFDILAFNEIDVPLWNIPEFFRRHQADLLIGAPVTESDPSLIMLRLPQPTSSEFSFVISY
jgi:hypothetical protein